MKKMLAVLLAVLLLLPLGGCTRAVQLSERAIVQAIGIDYEQGAYRLTLSLYSTGQGDRPMSQNKALQIEGMGETVAQALEQAQLHSGKQLFWGQNKLLVLGEAAARQGLEGALGFFAAGRQTRPNMDVITAEGTAKELLGTDGGQQGVAAFVKNIVENAERSGRSPRTRLMEVAGAQSIGGTGLCTPLLRAMRQESEGSRAELIGLALYRNGVFVATCDMEAARGVLWLRGKAQTAEIAVNGTHGQPLTMAVVGVQAKLRPSIVNGAPHITVECTVATRLSGEQLVGANLEKEENTAVETATRQIEHEIQAALTQTLGQNGSDVIGLARLLRKYEPQWYAQYAGGFKLSLAQTTYTLSVSSRVARYGRQN